MAEPRSFASWYAQLCAVRENTPVDRTAAAQLRIISSQRDNAVFLCAGVSALPYVHWLLDGMAMSSRCIVQLNADERACEPLTQQLAAEDIRVAPHCQNLDEFCSDISEHRIDLALLSKSTDIAVIESLLSARGLCVTTDGAEITEGLSTEDYFVASLGDGGLLTAYCRKGRQHRRTRRGIRRTSSQRVSRR